LIRIDIVYIDKFSMAAAFTLLLPVKNSRSFGKPNFSKAKYSVREHQCNKSRKIIKINQVHLSFGITSV